VPGPSTSLSTPTANANATATADGGSDAAASARPIGPYEIPFLDKRTVYFVVPSSRAKPQRLLANLHGMCNPPGYACGYWVQAASERGFLVCPTGNASCGPGAYNAPTWTESFDKMDEDLERALATVDAQYPGEITRDGAILTGFSRGAYAAAEIVKKHPGRWPYLLLNEADVALDAKSLRAAGVRAVAMVAGEIGGQVGGERATVARLVAQKFAARLWVMPKAGHFYSANIDDIMREAIAWLLSFEDAADGGADAAP
jgi:hypothetical protein